MLYLQVVDIRRKVCFTGIEVHDHGGAGKIGIVQVIPLSHSDFDITVPAQYGYKQFKNDVQSALEGHFGNGAVRQGNKAFDIHENSYRVDADVVACFEYRWYWNDATFRKGTGFLTDGGIRIENWPDQNYDNGVAKNDATNRSFKPIVRILKRLRNEMAMEGIRTAEPITGYLIECLVWNVPDEGFGHYTLRADIQWTLAHLFNNTRDFESCKEWGEINEHKYLFRASQPWGLQQKAHDFVSAAWDYIGFK